MQGLFGTQSSEQACNKNMKFSLSFGTGTLSAKHMFNPGNLGEEILKPIGLRFET